MKADTNSASAAMPPRPTIIDVFTHRLMQPIRNLPFPPAKHMIQSARMALNAGADEKIVAGCLLHDIGFAVMRGDHGWWGAQLIEPYVAEEVVWAVRYHQALRFYPDESVGYSYPELYVKMFGENYEPPDYISAAYRYARNHRWYMNARTITLFDDYSFDKTVEQPIEPFIDILGRHFRQPKEGLGNDNSPVAHMWRTIIDPDRLL
jgi:hypothetical protein